MPAMKLDKLLSLAREEELELSSCHLWSGRSWLKFERERKMSDQYFRPDKKILRGKVLTPLGFTVSFRKLLSGLALRRRFLLIG